MQIDDLLCRAACGGLIAIEIAILTALIVATRCANYPDVFVAGNVYFTDADCYARMTRVRMHSSAILGAPIPERSLCQILDRTPAQPPPFLTLVGQKGVNKVFRVENNR